MSHSSPILMWPAVRSSIRVVIGLTLVGLAGCGSPSPEEPPTPPASPSASASVAVDPLEGTWSTGPVPLENIRGSMLAAGLDREAIEGWIEAQGSPPEFTFELRFDSPDFSHSRADEHFPKQVDESGTYVLIDGELRIQHEEGTVEERETHRLYTVALYASAPFVHQP